MTDLIVRDTKKLEGIIKAPPSKSLTHRAVVAATLSDGWSRIEKYLSCDDTLATINACRLLGAEIDQIDEENLYICGIKEVLAPSVVINCSDSASTMRFITPICALSNGKTVISGSKNLMKRPMQPMLDALKELGVKCYSSSKDGVPAIVVLGGEIKGGRVSITGNVSSQFISGLLFATPLARSETEINLSSPLESKPYVALTLNILRKHGISIETERDYERFLVPGRQRYFPANHLIEGDYSSAAFILAAAAVMESNIIIENLSADSIQGDRVIIDLLKKMGVKISLSDKLVHIEGFKDSLNPIDTDMKDYPDLIPVFAVLACFASGKSHISGSKRLRFKETDRIANLVIELNKLGAKVEVSNNLLEITGTDNPKNTRFDSHGDHRIAMTCVVAALGSKGESFIHGIECINKSYPNFVSDIASLGGVIFEQ